ncbi:hypothetical protein INT47_009526 [Mucor saturninus]|uniref:BHLH domain-containing protein n=1 Tax=Mucor saturninus TaxID=64648 RepID=A0A8H7R8X4_9FUNG|nr:hypothetical protein INT47_009526 [Mucor saturninus]
MSTERKSKSTSTSPTMNDSQSTLNIRQRVFPPTASSSTNYPLGISFLSTSNTLNESEDMAYIEKRTAHNALERQRREGLNSKFQELAHVLPALQQIRRPSKSMIVAKSLEFVSNAVERQTDFEDQLDALRVENAQLLRQAQNSTKRIKKQVETDSTKTQKQPSHTVVKSSATTTTTTTTSGAIIKSRRLPSRLKPQLRQSSLPVSLLPPKIATEEPAAAAASAATTTMTTTSEDVSEIKPQQQQQIKKRQRDDESVHSNTSSSSSNHLLSPNTTKEMEIHMKKRKRNYTTNSSHQQQQQQQQHHHHQQQHASSNNHHEEIHRQQPMYRHRYGSHQPTTNGLDSIITPVQSRQNSITPLSDQLPLPFDNDNNETLIVPTQFDITTSPFGTEQYYNTYDHFEHVSSIPALRTPVGRSSSNNEVTVLSQAQQPPPPYEPTSLDILNSIMQEHHQDLDTTGANYYWHQ